VFKVAIFGLDASVKMILPLLNCHTCQSLAGQVRPMQTQCTHTVVIR